MKMKFLTLFVIMGIAIAFPQAEPEPESEPECDLEDSSEFEEEDSSESEPEPSRHQMMKMMKKKFMLEDCNDYPKMAKAYQTCVNNLILGGLRKEMMNPQTEKAAMGCIDEMELTEYRDEYVCGRGKYSPMPNFSFTKKYMMRSYMKGDKEAAMNLNCCIMKNTGMLKNDKDVNTEAIIGMMLQNVINPKVVQAVIKGRNKCPQPDNCMVMKYTKCIIDTCAEYLSQV